MTDFRATKYEQAVREGLTACGFYAQAMPSGDTLNAILGGLDAAGLLLTDQRLEGIAKSIEEIDPLTHDGQWFSPEQAAYGMQALAAKVVRAGGAL